MAPAATQTTENSPYTNALAADTAYGSAAPPAPRPPRASHMPGAVNETPHATMIWKGTDRKNDCFLTTNEPAGSADIAVAILKSQLASWQTKNRKKNPDEVDVDNPSTPSCAPPIFNTPPSVPLGKIIFPLVNVETLVESRISVGRARHAR
jgi:hypothetical protein